MSSTIAFNLRGQGTPALEIDLYEGIGGDPLFGGGIPAKTVLDALNASPNAKSILVRINSAGGIVTEGLAIYNLLKSHKAAVTCRVDSLAGSIASIIAMAGRLEMAEHSYLMIHNPFGWIEGGSSELRHQADVLDSMREEMVSIYCAKSGKGRDFIGALMDEETWLTGTQALAYGLCDGLIPDSTAKLAAHFDLSRFKNTPRSIDTAPRGAVLASAPVVAAEPIPAAAVAEAPTEEVTVTDSPAAIAAASGAKTMDEQVYKDQIAALEAKVAELVAALEGEKSARAKAEADAAEAKAKFPKKGEDGDDDDDEDEKAATQAVIEACVALTGCKDIKKLAGAVFGHADKLTTKQTAQTVAQRVSALIKDGKLRPDRKAMALKMSHEALDGYLEMTGGAKIAPVGEEHEPDDEHETVVAARAATKRAPATFDPESIQLTAEERAACRIMGGVDKNANEAAFLADKRARAKVEFDRSRGIAA